MVRCLFGLAALVPILTLPLTAHADTIDDFLLTGGGHTISYSLPSSITIPDSPSIEFAYATASATIDGVPGYSLLGGYDAIASSIGDLQLFVPQAIFGYSTILFQGPFFMTTELVPSDDPFNPFNIVATFTPGTYSLIGNGYSSPLEIGPDVPYTLSITPQTATAVTPEPSTLILFATGVFGLLGFAAIRRGCVELTH
jgi:PEP-CTERM motif